MFNEQKTMPSTNQKEELDQLELNEDGYINDFFDKINELSKRANDSELDGEIGGEND